MSVDGGCKVLPYASQTTLLPWQVHSATPHEAMHNEGRETVMRGTRRLGRGRGSSRRTPSAITRYQPYQVVLMLSPGTVFYRMTESLKSVLPFDYYQNCLTAEGVLRWDQRDRCGEILVLQPAYRNPLNCFPMCLFTCLRWLATSKISLLHPMTRSQGMTRCFSLQIHEHSRQFYSRTKPVFVLSHAWNIDMHPLPTKLHTLSPPMNARFDRSLVAHWMRDIPNIGACGA